MTTTRTIGRGWRAALVAVLLAGPAAVLGGPAEAAPAQEAPVRLTGIQRYQETTLGTSSPTSRHVSASCPPGKVTVGGGARTMVSTGQTTRGNVMLQALVPGATTYAAQAVEKAGGYSANWSLTAYVICADRVPGLELEVVGRSSDFTPYFDAEQGWVNDVAAPCPAGKRLLGTGGIVGGPAGRVSFQQLRPNQQGGYTFVQGVRESSVDDDFSVVAYAICARPVQGWHVAIDGTDYNTGRLQTATAACEADEQIVAAGLTKGDVRGFAHVDALVPSTLTGSLFTSGAIPDPTPTYRWNLASWAVCVDL
jgi:hypothetical protein